jgi:ubiquinone biosynthesis accessory factor UbiJ
MLQAVHALVRPAAMRRLTLLVNHVLTAEPAACQRLHAHRGKVVRVALVGAPPWWPFSAAERLQVTPAGLLEWLENAPDAADELTVRIAFENFNPETALALAQGEGIGALPLKIEGDASMAADVDWVARECRWDIEADIAAAAGPVVASQMAAMGRGFASVLRGFVSSRAPSSPARSA